MRSEPFPRWTLHANRLLSITLVMSALWVNENVAHWLALVLVLVGELVAEWVGRMSAESFWLTKWSDMHALALRAVAAEVAAERERARGPEQVP